ncbi:MAG: hypothetical protein ACI9OJ_001325 [Myxococcota bacterium]|jgi:hypothetical protein
MSELLHESVDQYVERWRFTDDELDDEMQRIRALGLSKQLSPIPFGLFKNRYLEYDAPTKFGRLQLKPIEFLYQWPRLWPRVSGPFLRTVCPGIPPPCTAVPRPSPKKRCAGQGIACARFGKGPESITWDNIMSKPGKVLSSQLVARFRVTKIFAACVHLRRESSPYARRDAPREERCISVKLQSIL